MVFALSVLIVAHAKAVDPLVVESERRGSECELITSELTKAGDFDEFLKQPLEDLHAVAPGLENKQGYFYQGAYMDCVRAVDYLCSRDDVDQQRIAAWGGSQGGGLSLATAALDQRVDFCAADIPFLCDWVRYFQLTKWPEVDAWVEADDMRSWSRTLQTLSYFDTLNLADQIRCPTVLRIGLNDEICPPETIFSVYNRITARKSHLVSPDKGHGLGAESRDRYNLAAANIGVWGRCERRI
jgi:cephalosporin-C deacetylase-like acetyl esterase